MSGRLPRFLPLACIPLCWGAAILLWRCTAQGIGLHPDSVQYLAAARRLVDGHGLQAIAPSGDWVPLTRFPPLYPGILAAAARLAGTDPLVAARWIHLLLLVMNTLLMARLLRRLMPEARWCPWVGALAFAASPSLLPVHGSALSEPLFLCFTLAALGMLVQARHSPRKRDLGWLALLGAAACLTRYAGVALATTISVCATPRSLDEKRVRSRWRCALLMLGSSVLPLLIWMLVRADRTTAAAGRSLGFHPPGWRDAQQAIATLWGWVFPFALPDALSYSLARSFPLVLVLGALIFIAWRRARIRPVAGARSAPAPTRPLLVFSCAYGVVVLLSRTIADAAIGFDDRMMAPLLAVGIALAVHVGCMGAHSARRGCDGTTRGGGRRRIAIGLVGVWVAVGVVRSLGWTEVARRDGLGFTTVRWTQSALLGRLEHTHGEARFVSNVPDAIYLRLGRPAALLPAIADPVSSRPNLAFPGELARLFDDVRTGEVCLVLFDEAGWRWYLPASDEILARWSNAALPVDKLEDGKLVGSCAR